MKKINSKHAAGAFSLIYFIGLFCFLQITAASIPALAASTQWQTMQGARLRMLAMKNAETGKIDGLVEIELKPGWKTYWLNPGSSGIPPEFDFSGSTGFKLEKISYQTPKIIQLPENTIIGYDEKAQFGFSGQTENKNSDLKLKLFIGFCKKICIPADVELSLPAKTLDQSDGKTAMRLELAKNKLTQAAREGFGIFEPAWLDTDGRLHVRAEISGKLTNDVKLIIRDGSSRPASGAIIMQRVKSDQEGKLQFSSKAQSLLYSDVFENRIVYTLIDGAKSVEGVFSIE